MTDVIRKSVSHDAFYYSGIPLPPRQAAPVTPSRCLGRLTALDASTVAWPASRAAARTRGLSPARLDGRLRRPGTRTEHLRGVAAAFR